MTRTVDLRGLGLGPSAPACVGPDGSVGVADQATLALIVISEFSCLISANRNAIGVPLQF